jgi:hypothetical protein
MYNQKANPQAEYRQQEAQRERDSATLAEKFVGMKSLTVDLSYFGPRAVARPSQVKYTVNLAHAKSLFRFHCPNVDCMGGDFDLSNELANAVTTHQTTATGELVCQGWHKKSSIPKMPCQHMLRYQLTVGY